MRHHRLGEHLSRHPDVFFNALKETHIFATDFPRYRATKSLDAFLGLYTDAETTTVLGDASPMAFPPRTI